MRVRKVKKIMLTGEAKKKYQREYMKKHRSNKDNVRPVRPITSVEPVRPKSKDVRPDVRPTKFVRPTIVEKVRLAVTPYKAPQPAWMLPGAEVKQVKPVCPAWLKKS